MFISVGGPRWRFLTISAFLDAPSHLYKRVCPSVRMSACPCIRVSVSILKNSVYRVLGASYVLFTISISYSTSCCSFVLSFFLSLSLSHIPFRPNAMTLHLSNKIPCHKQTTFPRCNLAGRAPLLTSRKNAS